MELKLLENRTIAFSRGLPVVFPDCLEWKKFNLETAIKDFCYEYAISEKSKHRVKFRNQKERRRIYQKEYNKQFSA